MAIVDLPEHIPDLRRVYLLAGGMMLGIFAIIARLWYLQIAHGEEFRKASEVNRSRLIRHMAPRGQIVDRSGRVLATNRQQIIVSVVPEELPKDPQEREELLHRLASLLDMAPEALEETLGRNKQNRFDPVKVAVDVDIGLVTRIEEQRSRLPGVLVEQEPLRHYLDGARFGHLLGQMGEIPPEELKARRNEGYRPGDFCGKLGLERAYDKFLRGTDGGQKVEVDARGRMRRVLSNADPIPGATIKLTIDTSLQKVAYDALAPWAAKGKPGAAVALDPQTGAVLALVSVPSYDPNLFVRGISARDWKRLQSDPGLPQINRAISSAYAPGSTFKVITATAGLETGKITPHDHVYCRGSISLGRWRKRCHRRGGHGSVDLNAAIARSCDVYFYRLGQRLGPERMAAFARRFGLGTRTGIDLLREGDPQIERDGIVPDPAYKAARRLGRWVPGETVDYAIGQAMLACTPIQMCNVAAALANGGTLYRPQLVHSITAYDEEHRPHVVRRLTPQPIKRLAISAQTRALIVRGMVSVMQPGGTGSASAIPGLSMAGKTGTAEMYKKGRRVNNAWFIAFAPVEKPRIAVCVFVEAGGHGGAVAAPIARKIIAHYLNIRLNTASGKNNED